MSFLDRMHFQEMCDALLWALREHEECEKIYQELWDDAPVASAHPTTWNMEDELALQEAQTSLSAAEQMLIIVAREWGADYKRFRSGHQIDQVPVPGPVAAPNE